MINLIDEFNIRDWIASLDGGAGGRSVEDLDAIKRKLPAMMMHVGEIIRRAQKECLIDPYVEDPKIIEALKDIDALLNEILFYEY